MLRRRKADVLAVGAEGSLDVRDYSTEMACQEKLILPTSISETELLSTLYSGHRSIKGTRKSKILLVTVTPLR